jgi:predicted enzyme related to lactoylglutathione lyase
MIERDGYIAGVPCWVDTTQPDPEKAVAFYGQLFGWAFENVMPPEAPAPYHMARLRGGDVAAVAAVPEGAPAAALWRTYIWVASAEDTAAKAAEAGGNVLVEPFPVGDDGKTAVIADPVGAVFNVWEANQHRGARIVNEPGSLNFNELNTRDVEAAKAFYGSVFGWETLALGGANEFWTLPGYADHIEEIDPGFKERMAESGVPGFEDVVASLSTVPDGDEGPAHWSVTFAIEDADKTAMQARELGATIVAEPFDAPWVRATVITDPQGATFTASQFVPENAALPA